MNLQLFVSDNNQIGCGNYQDGEYRISNFMDSGRGGEENYFDIFSIFPINKRFGPSENFAPCLT